VSGSLRVTTTSGRFGLAIALLRRVAFRHRRPAFRGAFRSL
jgi:hypothetical protein